MPVFIKIKESFVLSTTKDKDMATPSPKIFTKHPKIDR